jgi:stearoyl-CoA desaturase (delta-9 desaturase)
MIEDKVVHTPRLAAATRRHAIAMLVLGNSGVLAALALAAYGVLPSAADLAIGAIYTCAISIGSAIGYHRLLAHRSFRTPPLVRAAFAVVGSMTMQGPPIFWAALHRRHHECADGPGDPHSPHLRADGRRHASRAAGLLHAYVGWTFAHEIPNPLHYTPDLLRDRYLLRVNASYPLWVALGLLAPALTGLLWAGSWLAACTALLWGGLIRLWFWHQMTWYITSFAHTHGSRAFACRDLSRNSFWMALPTFGESWHNTHHAQPHAAYLALRWWQLDITGLCILLLRALGLAREVRRLRVSAPPNRLEDFVEQST